MKSTYFAFVIMLVAFGPLETGHAQTGVSVEPSKPDIKLGGRVARSTVEDEPAPRASAGESSLATRIREFGARGVDEVSQVFRSPSIESIKARMEDRVEIGLRSISYQLDTDHKSSNGGRNTFLGTITDLAEDNDLAPTRIFVDYLVTPFWGFELSYDKIAATAKTSPVADPVKSDGDVTLSGPILSVFGRYPNDTAFAPYAGLGIAFYNVTFDETAHWALGYSGPAEYAAVGRPRTPNGGRTRSMAVDVDPAFVIYGGALWNFRDHWALDVYIRQLDVDVDAAFTGRVRGRVEQVKKGSFPMGHVACGASIHYIF